jgi:tRNA(adenine34) deaminase
MAAWHRTDGSITIERIGDYSVKYNLAPLADVAKETKSMPESFILGANDVTEEFKNYARPLLGDLPVYERLNAPIVEGVLDKWPSPAMFRRGWIVMNGIHESELRFMVMALDMAEKAAESGETPVGAVVALNGQVIGTGFNRVEVEQDACAHAEIIAMREASRKMGSWRLSGSTVYVTLEPCIMCAAAMIHTRVGRLVFGAHDERWGGFGSLFDLAHDPRINHEVEVIPGVMAKEAAHLLRSFYRRLRGMSEWSDRESKHLKKRRDAREAEGGW